MQHVEAMEFFDRVVDDEDGPDETVTLEHQSGAALEVHLKSLDRKEILDQLKNLPDSMVEAMTAAEDPEEAEEKARERNLMADVDGSTVKAFEALCTKGIKHPELTEHNIELMVKEFDFEVLFSLGSQIIELSFEDGGAIKDFHAQD